MRKITQLKGIVSHKEEGTSTMVKGNRFTLGRGQILRRIEVKPKASPLPPGEGKCKDDPFQLNEY